MALIDPGPNPDQALPLLFVDVIGPEFGPHGANLGTTYIGLYLIVYLVPQWNPNPVVTVALARALAPVLTLPLPRTLTLTRTRTLILTLALTLTQGQPAEGGPPPAQALFEPDGIPPVHELL